MAGQTPTFGRGMALDILFSITVYRTGQLRIDGHGRTEALPDILRLIATAVESGATVMTPFDDGESSGADADG